MIPLDEIDSAESPGERTVMEVLVHSDAQPAAKEFLLETFMNGFLYEQYIEKWKRFGRTFFVFRMALLFLYVALLTLIASPSVVNDPRRVFYNDRPDVFLADSRPWVIMELSTSVILFLWYEWPHRKRRGLLWWQPIP